MAKNNQKKIFILGAGFSQPAGLPLGLELLREINQYVNATSSHVFQENVEVFNGAIKDYCEYSKNDIDKELTRKNLDVSKFQGIYAKLFGFIRRSGYFGRDPNPHIEDVIEFLDHQHFLKFHGSLDGDSESSISQQIMRFLIAAVLNQKLKCIRKKTLYKKFVGFLCPEDIIISLNYDTLLERVLEEEKIEYRLFPPTLCEKRLNFSPKPGVTILKVHGSINWFDYSEYRKIIDRNKRDNHGTFQRLSSDFIFNNQVEHLDLQPLIPSGFKTIKETRLKDVYCISPTDLDSYIEAYNSPWDRIEKGLPRAITHPVILGPSYTKLLYSQSIKDLFYDASQYGADADKIIIIGCSVAQYDRYIRQWLFDISRMYYGRHKPKKNILVVNRPSARKVEKELKMNYSFMGKGKVDYNFNGFSEKVLPEIFDI